MLGNDQILLWSAHLLLIDNLRLNFILIQLFLATKDDLSQYFLCSAHCYYQVNSDEEKHLHVIDSITLNPAKGGA